MGNRANLILVENGEWRLYYSHWVGCRMLDALAFGPEMARRYFESQRHCARDEWTDPVWADGGAVVDFDRRRLIFFGDELMETMPERRAMLAVLALTWLGFEVGWAYGGTDELVAYLGVDPRWELGRPGQELTLAHRRDDLCHVVSVVGANGSVRLWPLWWGSSAAWHGPDLLDRLPGKGLGRLSLGMIPESGVHVDISRATVGVWLTGEARGVFDELPRRWTQWEIECWDDRYEEQVLRCAGRLRTPELDMATGAESALGWVRKRVYQSFEDSPMGAVLGLARTLGALQPGLAVGADAVGEMPERPTAAEWALFEGACRQVSDLYTKAS